MAGIVIRGTGKSAGIETVTNDQLAEIVDTSDEWIKSKTGICKRHFAKNQSNTDMAIKAAKEALKNSQVAKENIGVIIACTFSADYKTPAMACSVAKALDISGEVMAFDLNGACSGFIYGCKVSDALLEHNPKKFALVIGSEKISPWMDMDDRGTCVLFGDGAGAAVVEYTEDADFTFFGASIPDLDVLNCPQGGKIQMSGQEVYRFAVSNVPKCIKKVLEKAGKISEDIDYFVCHQANERIIDNVAIRMSLKNDKRFYKNLYEYGNTSAASIPIALGQMYEEDLLKKGSQLLCTGFGAGLTLGGMLIEYRGNENEN